MLTSPSISWPSFLLEHPEKSTSWLVAPLSIQRWTLRGSTLASKTRERRLPNGATISRKRRELHLSSSEIETHRRCFRYGWWQSFSHHVIIDVGANCLIKSNLFLFSIHTLYLRIT